MTITALPAPPSPLDTPADFNSKSFNLLGALPNFVTEANALQSDVAAKQAAAASSEGVATSKAAAAAASEGVATAKAAAAASSEGVATAKAGEAAASAASVAATLASALWRDMVFVTAANSPVTLSSADNGKLYVADTTGGAITFDLPQISGVTLPYNVGVKLEAGGNAVTINRSGTDTIGGATSKSIYSVGGGVQLLADTDPAPDVWTSVDFGRSTGNYTDETKIAGVDFTAGVSTSITLSNDYGSEPNISVHFDTAFQGPDTYTLTGTTLSFTSAIPGGVAKVYVKGGAAVAIGTPGDATVSAAKLTDAALPDKVHSAASKATPVDADEMALVDSAAGNGLKRITWANVKAALLAYFQGALTTLTGGLSVSGGGIIETGVFGIGYGTGAGGTVTQATNQSTAVTINKPTGAITMFSAAGSSSWNSFTVNNSLVAATDTVVVSTKTGSSNAYNVFAGKVAAGSFIIYFQSIFGTATEAPVINFSVIKGATA